MALTRRQQWRIDKVQSEKIARASKASIKAESDIDNSEICLLYTSDAADE